MPPPSSGGVHLVQMLNIAGRRYPFGTLGLNSADTIHRMAEATRRAYADRTEYLGDPDFVEVPVEGAHLQGLRRGAPREIDPERAPPRPRSGRATHAPREPETTHFSVVDELATRSPTPTPSTSATASDRRARDRHPPQQRDRRLLGQARRAQRLRPDRRRGQRGRAGKRTLSSMTPTIVLKDGKKFLVTGSPGGSRIITTMLQVIINVIDHGMNIARPPTRRAFITSGCPTRSASRRASAPTPSASSRDRAQGEGGGRDGLDPVDQVADGWLYAPIPARRADSRSAIESAAKKLKRRIWIVLIGGRREKLGWGAELLSPSSGRSGACGVIRSSCSGSSSTRSADRRRWLGSRREIPRAARSSMSEPPMAAGRSRPSRSGPMRASISSRRTPCTNQELHRLCAHKSAFSDSLVAAGPADGTVGFDAANPFGGRAAPDKAAKLIPCRNARSPRLRRSCASRRLS